MNFFKKQKENTVSPLRTLPFDEADRQRALLRKSFDIYCGKAPWLSTGTRSLNLAASICSEITRLCLCEMNLSYLNPPKTERENALSKFSGSLSRALEYACACGSVIFKPSFDGKELSVCTVLPFDFYPISYFCDGSIKECGFVFRQSIGSKNYVRIEEHRMNEDGYVITNEAFIDNSSSLTPCPLNAVPSWSALTTKCCIKGLRRPLFVCFSTPQCNCDSSSLSLGTPVFRRAEGLIKEADMQFERLVWEFEGGELAIDASEDAFRVGKDGKPKLPTGKERLYRTNLLDSCCSTNELLKTFSPSLRDTSLINGLNRILMFVEDTCGLSRGTFSDPNEIAKTATEVRSSKQKTFCTVTALQKSLKSSLYELYFVLNDLSTLYCLPCDNNELNISFGDSVLNDSDSLREVQREDVIAGIISADEYKNIWYDQNK